MKELFLFLAWLAEGAEQMKSYPDMTTQTPVEGIFYGLQHAQRVAAFYVSEYSPPYDVAAALDRAKATLARAEQTVRDFESPQW